jgi:hypothetical protein
LFFFSCSLSLGRSALGSISSADADAAGAFLRCRFVLFAVVFVVVDDDGDDDDELRRFDGDATVVVDGGGGGGGGVVGITSFGGASAAGRGTDEGLAMVVM